jgi:hypothetical protein
MKCTTPNDIFRIFLNLDQNAMILIPSDLALSCCRWNKNRSIFLMADHGHPGKQYPFCEQMEKDNFHTQVRSTENTLPYQLIRYDLDSIELYPAKPSWDELCMKLTEKKKLEAIAICQPYLSPFPKGQSAD